MTEKQFTTDYYNFVRDDRTYIKDNNVRMTYEQITDLLNSLSEENKQLKRDNKILMDKMFEMRTNDALNRTEISKQNYSVNEFLEELEKW